MKEKSKILFIGPLPPPFSGPELSMKIFLESKILNDAFQIIFLKTNFRKDNTEKGKLDFSMIFNFFFFFSRLIYLLITIKPKCVYYPITPTQIGWIGRDILTILISKLFSCKIIIHLRGSHFKLNFQKFNSLIKKVVGCTLTYVDNAIVQAKYLNDQFYPYIKKNKISVLYQAVDSDLYTNKHNHVEKGKILVIGHMTKAKGYTDILKIIPEVCEIHPHVKFYFAGDMRKGERGVFYNQYTGENLVYEDPFLAEKTILDSKYKNNYVNLKIIKDKEKINHLQSMQIFLSASYSEGFSRSLLESMSMGKPTIFTPVGAHYEVFKRNIHGIIVEPGKTSQIKDAILNLLNDEKKCEFIGYNNRKNVVKNFTLDKICMEFKSIILKTLKYENIN